MTATDSAPPRVAIAPRLRFAMLEGYFLSEMVLPFLFGVVAFTSIGTAIGSLFELVRLVAEKGLPLSVAMQLYVLQSPRIIVLTFPMSTLLATLLAYGRLSGDSEVTALRSCGVSTYRLIVPALMLSLTATGGTFLFNEAIVPQANLRAETLLQTALENRDTLGTRNEDILYQEFGEVAIERPDGSLGTESALQRLFYARRFDGETMFGITVLDFSQQDFNQVIVADEGVWQEREHAWLFSDGTTYIVDALGNYSNILKFESQQVFLPRTPLDLGFSRSPEQMNIRQLKDHIQAQAQAGNFRKVRRLQVDLQLKYAIPFICLTFALVGAPLGMRSQRSSSALGLGLSILIIFGFYTLTFVSQALGQTGALTPVMAAWLPNIAVSAIGLSLIYRAARV
ncbi:LptF/LptG family permease [Synechococcus sp. PCC 7336]|uniref:LptF/LptG family permease n=1 Tax=Synechococcus sp. PCC 7336 TaxID=195250 RepID=UPI00034550CF|nr:LptF/LptG family permease [Synechococcus sp. PCC 7336]